MSLTAESKELRGKITFSRPSGNLKEEYVNIAIVDQLSGAEFVDLRIALDDFARAITGQGYVECVFEFRGAVVGKKSEHKTELVPAPGYTRDESKIAELLAPFEVDGWKARRSDMTNHHLFVRGAAGESSFQRVTFFRHVEPDTGEPVIKT